MENIVIEKEGKKDTWIHSVSEREDGKFHVFTLEGSNAKVSTPVIHQIDFDVTITPTDEEVIRSCKNILLKTYYGDNSIQLGNYENSL